MMWWRRKSWRAERPHARLPDELPHTVDPTDGFLDQRDWAWREIQRLAPRQRAVVVLRYYEDLSERQIAETLGCSAGTVKRQAHDALATLRQALGDELVPELAKEGSS